MSSTQDIGLTTEGTDCKSASAGKSMMRRKYIKTILLIFISLIFALIIFMSSCTRCKHIVLDRQSDGKDILVSSSFNPTEYVYPYKIDSVRIALVKLFGLYAGATFQNLTLKESNKSVVGVYTRDTLFSLENFRPIISLKAYSSKVYFDEKNKPLSYQPDAYIIELKELDTNKTLVSVKVKDAKVFIGKAVFPTWCIHSWDRAYIYQKVLPTTVEEYEILLLIGKWLKVENMPSLIIPNPIIIKHRHRLR